MDMNSALVKAIRNAYRLGQEDEALEPIIAFDDAGKAIGRIGAGDSVIFYDIRGEREIEITESLTKPDFAQFSVEKDLNLNFVTMIEYHSTLGARVAFPPEKTVRNTFTEVITKNGFSLVKIAE
jgi:2,3-bisphosphoglycerate-independent phosphoglycerate mutase